MDCQSLFKGLGNFYEVLKRCPRESEKGKISRELLEEQTRLLKQYMDSGEYVNALGVAEKLLEMEETESYWVTVGYLFTQMKEYERSLIAYQNVLRLNPGNERVWFNIGYSFLVLGDVRQALRAFNKAVKLAPDEDFRKKAEKGSELCLRMMKG